MNTEPIVDGSVEAVLGRRPSRKVSSSFNWRRFFDSFAEKIIFAVAFIAIAIIFLIFIYVAREALPLVTGSAGGLLLASPFKLPMSWQPVSGVPKYNVLPLVLGTFKVTLIALLIATPLALAAALYSSEFAPGNSREWIKPAIELLAGIPSVVDRKSTR